MKKSKRVISLLLSVIMLMSVINTGFVAFAADATGYVLGADEAEMLPDAGAVVTSTQVVRVASGHNSYQTGNVIVAATPSGIPAVDGHTGRSNANVGDINEEATFPEVKVTFENLPDEDPTVTCVNANSVASNIKMSKVTYDPSEKSYSWKIESGTANAGDTLIFKVAYTYQGKQYVSNSYSYVESVSQPAGNYVETKVSYEPGWWNELVNGEKPSSASISAATRVLGINTYGSLGAFTSSSSDRRGFYDASNNKFQGMDASQYSTYYVSRTHSTETSAVHEFLLNDRRSYADIYVDTSVTKSFADLNLRFAVAISKQDGDNTTQSLDTIVTKTGNVNASNDLSGTADVDLGPVSGGTGVMSVGDQYVTAFRGTTFRDGQEYTLVTKLSSSNGGAQNATYFPVGIRIHTVNKGELRTLINDILHNNTPETPLVSAQYKGVNPQSWYYSSGFSAYESAMLAAQTILQNPRSTQNEIDGAIASLTEAYDGLVLKEADYSGIDEATEEALEYEAVKNLYTEDSFAELEKAISVYGTTNPDGVIQLGYSVLYQPQVDLWAADIHNAIENLEYTLADYTRLNELLAEAREKEAHKDDYVDFSAVEAAMNKVDFNIKINEQSKVDKMADDLEDALRSLKNGGANYSEVEAAIALARTKSRVHYTEASYARLDSAVKNVKYSLDVTQQSIVDGYAAEILDAIDKLEELPANYVELESYLTRIDNLVEDNYYPESYQAAKAAAAECRASGYDKIGITRQAEIDAMRDNLKAVYESLQLKEADYSAIEALIQQYETEIKDNPDISQDSIVAVKSAIDLVEYGLKADEQYKVDNFAYRIETAIAALKYKAADYTAVDRAIAEADKIDRTYYSAESIARLDAALDKVVRGYGVNRQSEVDMMAANINEALNTLQPGPADYTRVNTAIQRFNALNHSHYTTASVAGVQAVINAINWELTKKDQGIVNGYAFDISDKMLELVEAKANYDELRRIRDNEIPADLSKYTQESVKDLNNVLNSIDWNLNAKDQDKVVGYQTALQNAIKNLTPLPGDYTEVDKAIAKGREIIATTNVNQKDADAFEEFVSSINRNYTHEQQEEIVKLAAQIKAMYEKFSASESVHKASITLEADKTLTYTGDIITVSVIVGTDYYAAATSIPVLYDSNFFELVGSTVDSAFQFEGSFATSSITGGNINSPAKGYPSSYTENEKKQWKYALITIAPDSEINDDAQILDPAQTVVKLQFKVKNLVALNGKIWVDDAFLKTDDNKTGKLYIGRYKTPEVNNEVAPVGQTIDTSKAILNINVVDSNAPADFEELMMAINRNTQVQQNKNYYTTETFSVYTEAYTAALNIFMNQGQYTVKEQYIVNEATDALNKAYNELEFKPADTAALEEALALTPDYTSDKYVVDTYITYQNAVDAGSAILAEENLTVMDQTRIDDAAVEIVEAFENLTLKPFSYQAMLDGTLLSVPEYDGSFYEEEAYEKYDTAYTALVEFADKGELTILDDSEGLSLITAVNIWYSMLVLKGADTSPLEDALNAEFDYKDEADYYYTEDTYAEYEAAVDAGLEILSRDDLTIADDEDIIAAADAIYAAIDMLEFKPFPDEVQEQIDIALGEWFYEEDDSVYDPESIDNFWMAYDELAGFWGEDIRDVEYALELIENLRYALDNMKYAPADLSLLEEALSLEVLDEEYYTEDSYQPYKDAIAELESYGEDYYWTAAEQDIIDEIAVMIMDAYYVLELKPFSMVDELEAAIAVTPEYDDYYYNADVYAEYLDALAVIEDIIANADSYTILDDEIAVEAIDNYNAALEALKSAWADADYSDVEAAIDEANDLNRDIYTNFEIVDEAINNVVYGLNIFEQETVDGFAAAIREAIGNLESKGADYTAVVKAISDAEDLLENMRATGIELKQSTVDDLDSAINDVDYDLDVTQQDVVDGFADAIIAATEALDYVSTIVLVDESAAYITEENYIKGLANIWSEEDIISQFTVYGKETTIVVTPTAEGFGTGTLVQHFDGEELVAEYVIIVNGDANGDASVDAIDVTIVTNLINEFEEPETQYIMAAIDLENDGWLDAIDLTIIINMANYDE